jgi:filamentous hemagglutinin family protein
MVRYWMGLLLSVGVMGCWSDGVLAQSVIVPDGTLGGERSQVEFRAASERITGGAARGINLFHSFREFNVGEGRTTYFIAPNSGIENILARVTGNNQSDIMGKLGTAQLVNNGLGISNANLFLINPNGILFGKNSSLDVDRSFVATTANAIGFGDRGTFTTPQPGIPKALLTIAPSVFLFDQVNAAPIQVDSNNLYVGDRQSLLLLGGNIILNNSSIGVAERLGGRVELGGLEEQGKVYLDLDKDIFKLIFPAKIMRGDVILKNGSAVNVVAEDGGSIAVYAKNLSILGGSSLVAGIGAGLGKPNSQAGDIILEITEKIIVDQRSFIENNVYREAIGNSGDVRIRTNSLLITGESNLGTFMFGQGNAGNVAVNANFLEINGLPNGNNETGILSEVKAGGRGNAGNIHVHVDFLYMMNDAGIVSRLSGEGRSGYVDIIASSILLTDRTYITTRVKEGAIGNGGNINIQTKSLTLRTGSQISSFVTRQQKNSDGNITPGGQGNAGEISIDATDFITLSGTNLDGFSAGIIATTERGASGLAGDIKVNAGNLKIENAALIAASTYNSSQGGNISINARSLELLNGGQIVTSTRGSGNAGKIQINAPDNTVISGRDENFSNRIDRTKQYLQDPDISRQFENVDDLILNEGSVSGVITSALSQASGDSGNIFLTTSNLNLNNRGVISAQSEGIGKAGDIGITANNSVNVNDGNILTAAIISGGDINISAKSIRLQGDSDIQTNAIKAIGGNITLTADSIVALNDSDILAFAKEGAGGNVTLNTRAFFGQNYRPAPFGTDPTTLDGNDRVDINASGSLSSGTITRPDTSFIQNSLNQLPKDTIDTTKLLANTCIVRKDKPEGTFYITGTGGLPNRPGDPSLSNYPTNTLEPTQTATHLWQKGDPIEEPTGFYKLANGRLVMSRECSSESIAQPSS